MKTLFLSGVLAICWLTSPAQHIYDWVAAGMQAEQAARGSQASLPSVSSYADTAHVSKYIIHIDTVDFSNQSIRGWTEATIVAQVAGPTQFRLSLLELSIDSVLLDNQLVPVAYDDTTIIIPLPAPLAMGDSVNAKVYYQGSPKKDASGWGGFYFNGNTAFNLGVGFAANPHNLGKVWFPCIDAFDDKSLYEFYVNTESSQRAVCNGVLVSQTANPNGTITWHWRMDQPIPTYLACMAVAPFIIKEADYNGLPVHWACFDSDTNNINATFQNFNPVMDAFVSAYGPYPFDKVGYTLVPFNSGAMEHATAIAIGRPFINGMLTYEALWAHELSHMWWGDKVTCRTAEDMWLNEGWATWNEAYMTEQVYGDSAYYEWIHNNHRNSLQFAHVPARDGAYLAMNAIPQEKTYGMHSYQKGADVIHTMRHYMEDSAFFQGCQHYMNNRAYGNASSADLRDDLTAGSGVDMTRFFDDWIFTPGWPHFSIDSVVYWPGGLDHYFVYTRQRSRGNNHIYEVPVEISLSNGTTDTFHTVVIDSATNMFHIATLGVFDWFAIDRAGKVSDAIVDREISVTGPGTKIMNDVYVTLVTANAGTGSNTVRIEHSYVLPDGFSQSNPGIRLSDYHYYHVDGSWSPGFLASAQIKYDGSLGLSTGYLDNNLITGTEDSLVILHRAGTWDDWQQVPGSMLVTGPNKNDKRGHFVVDTLRKGEYVFGYYDHTVGTIDVGAGRAAREFSVIPNPSADRFEFSIALKKKEKGVLVIFDDRGKEIWADTVKHGKKLTWDASGTGAGLYFASLFIGEKRVASRKLVLAR